MRDPFTDDPTHPDYNNTRLAAYDLIPVTPSDTTPLGFTALGVYVQPGRKLSFRTAAGEDRTIPIAADNFQLRVGITQIYETGSDSGRSGDIDNPASPEYEPWVWVMKPYRN